MGRCTAATSSGPGVIPPAVSCSVSKIAQYASRTSAWTSGAAWPGSCNTGGSGRVGAASRAVRSPRLRAVRLRAGVRRTRRRRQRVDRRVGRLP
jgi:hypothetical protein